MTLWDCIIEQIGNIENQYKDVFKKIEAAQDGSKQRLNLTDGIPNYHESINSIRARLTTALGLFKSLLGVDTSRLLIPMPYLNNLNSGLRGIHESLNAITGSFTNLDANGGIASINPSNWDVLSVNQAFTFNIAAQLQAIDSQLDKALDGFYSIHGLVQRPDYTGLSDIGDTLTGILDEFAERRSEVVALADEVKKSKKQVEGVVANVNTQLQTATDINKQIDGAKQSADNKLKDITTAEASVVLKMPTIEDVHTKVTALKKDVEDYKPQFEKFKEQLEQRVKKYTEGNIELEKLLKSLIDQEIEIKRINGEASAALNFATVAGIAKGFEDRRAALDIELKNAYRWYVGAVVSLFVTTMVPASYVVAIIFKLEYVKDTTEIDYHALVTLLLLVVPSAIMTRFTSSRYNSLFRLREQYAHKFSIAFSMEGFKKALKEDEQNKLVATTFAQLSSNNPADSIDNKSSSSSEEHPLPIWEKCLDFICPSKK
ncbi:MAG: hypothetical protein ACK502_07655 [Alphaproteobacteria bacterium]